MMAAWCRRRRGRAGWPVWLLLPLLAFALPAGAADVEVQVSGVDSVLRDNAVAYVGKLTPDELKSWRSTRARINDSLRDAMQSQGYYDASFQVDHTADRVIIAIVPGEPVRVRTLHLVFKGEAGNDIAFTALRENMPLKEGDIFHHGNYEALKNAVQTLGVEHGYFDADWVEHSVAIDPAAHAADIELVYDSGVRYRFGHVTFKAADGGELKGVQPGLLERMQTFAEDDPYDANQVIKFNKVLLDSRYFSEVRVRLLREKAVDHAIPVEVSISREKPNTVGVGVGYSTDVRERLSLNWRRPFINRYGHSIEASAELSPVRSSFDSRYIIPLTHPINDTLQFFYGVKREEVENVVTWNTVLGMQRQIKWEGGWQRTYSLRWNRDTTEPPDAEVVKKDLVLPGVGVDRTRSKGGVDPFWGDRFYAQTEVASKEVLSDANLVSLRGGFRFLRTVADRHQFLLRGDAGAIITDNFDDVPQSMRFFAGGDQSVRGYGYKSLSPRDANGVAVGARNLLTGSVEYDYMFISHWRAAIFVDGGNAFDSPTEPFKIGSGVGIRWISPVGPIRLDFAWAVSEPNRPFRLHLSMGPSL